MSFHTVIKQLLATENVHLKKVNTAGNDFKAMSSWQKEIFSTNKRHVKTNDEQQSFRPLIS